MGELRFQVKVTAMGEVRDKDGNLISSEPIEMVTEATESELVEHGIPIPQHPTKEKTR